MFIYETPPLDNFTGMMRIDDVVASIISEHYVGDKDRIFNLFRLVMDCSREVSIFAGSSWLGDVRDKELYVFALPGIDGGDTRLGIVWKQENNGTTFVCSPVELPWLKGICYAAYSR